MCNNCTPHGFVLSEAALYSFKDQDVFPDLLSFCSAIPEHLRPLFLIPIQVDYVDSANVVASRVASRRYSYVSVGNSEEADWFGTKTFVYDDNEPTVPQSDPGSIFDIDGADEITHHQERDFDENIQVPTDTSYMSDFDGVEVTRYPYRTEEKPVRHSSRIMIIKMGMEPEELEVHTPEKIQDNAGACTVKLLSYDKKNRIYSFEVDCGQNRPHVVRSTLSDLRHIALTCDCPFWRWNGPEFHAKENSYLLGKPRGTAEPPNVRDPDRKYWLCKHAFAVTSRIDNFISQIVSENLHLASEGEILDEIHNEWDRLESAVEIPLEEIEEEEDVDVEWEELEEEEPEEEEKPEEELIGDVDWESAEFDIGSEEEPEEVIPESGEEPEEATPEFEEEPEEATPEFEEEPEEATPEFEEEPEEAIPEPEEEPEEAIPEPEEESGV